MCTSIIEIARAEGVAKRGKNVSRSPRRWLLMTTRAVRRWRCHYVRFYQHWP